MSCWWNVASCGCLAMLIAEENSRATFVTAHFPTFTSLFSGSGLTLSTKQGYVFKQNDFLPYRIKAQFKFSQWQL